MGAALRDGGESEGDVSKSVEVNSTGISFFAPLAIVFITLKLCGVTEVAEWSWFWVLAPLWIPFALAILIFAVFAAIAIWVSM